MRDLERIEQVAALIPTAVDPGEWIVQREWSIDYRVSTKREWKTAHREFRSQCCNASQNCPKARFTPSDVSKIWIERLGTVHQRRYY